MKRSSTIKPKKSLGQHFLINVGILQKTLDAASISSEDTIIEVGPGKGILTEALAKKAKKVIAIEKDVRLIPILKDKFKGWDNVRIIQGDVLKINISELIFGEYKVVANLPYYITSHFLEVMFTRWPKPSSAVLMVQREVGQRIMAKPPHMNLLALSVQAYGHPSIIQKVSRGSFYPAPDVDSVILKIVLDEKNKNPEEILSFAGLWFKSKRKQLLGLLISSFKQYTREELGNILEGLGIQANARPENLSFDQWAQLHQRLKI
ncbi:MAG TPA: 16S rRNA (adenine(1518)-N(6)/adenine(1519)-N(6))-dimethyltransferase RsmA [Candidatus Paceibacterota bacterium]